MPEEEEKEFDWKGLLRAHEEITKAYSMEAVKGVTGCAVCLGCNVPDGTEKEAGAWCCGTICDGFTEPLGFCKRFQLSEKGLKRVLEKVRTKGEGMTCYRL